MKNLLLVGDSIRAGYDKSVKKTLEGKVNVIFPEDNCRFASYILRYFNDYLCGVKGEDIDVVHWNTGLWDCLRMFGEEPHTPIDIYEYYIDRICKRIKNTCPNATVIFATTTKVIPEKMTKDFMRDNKEIDKYNEAAIKVCKKHGFKINDLCALCESLPETAHSDGVHFYTQKGTESFTNQVLSVVLPELGIEEKLEYREDMYTDEPVGI